MDAHLVDRLPRRRPILCDRDLECLLLASIKDRLHRPFAIGIFPNDGSFLFILHRTSQDLRSTGTILIDQDSHWQRILDSLDIIGL